MIRFLPLLFAGLLVFAGAPAQGLNPSLTHDKVYGRVSLDDGGAATGEIEFVNVVTHTTEARSPLRADGTYEVLLPKKGSYSFCLHSPPFIHFYNQPENQVHTSTDEIVSQLELNFTVMQYGVGTGLNLEGFQFESHSAELNAAQKALLDQLAAWLQAHQGIKVQAAGHANEEADEAANRALSRKRATACQAYLAEKGIAMERLLVFGYGSTRPLPGAEVHAPANARTSFIIFEHNK